MSKRPTSCQTYICKPCRATYNTQAQLVRHKEDRHGPQVTCTLCQSQAFVVPKKRTDNMRRHLEQTHGMPKLTLEAVKSYFLPFFEEAPTPIQTVTVKSVVNVPGLPTETPKEPAPTSHQTRKQTDSPMFMPVELTFESSLPCCLEEFLQGALEDSPRAYLPEEEPSPEPSPEPAQNTVPETAPATAPETAPATAPETAPETAPIQTLGASLPDLELDPMASKPTLAMPVRYITATCQPEQEEEEEAPGCPDSPPPEPSSGKEIPLDNIEADIFTYKEMPRAKPDRTEVISGVCAGPAPEFPPRRVRVPSRRSLDPRLLFRDAPSAFLPGALAGLVARHRRDTVRQADLEQVEVEFGCQDGTILREETVSLADGRMVTMKTSVILRDSIKISRSTQTQTE